MKMDLLKEHYFFELTRKQTLEGSLALPVAVLTALGGVVFTMITTFEYAKDCLTYAFVGSLVLVFIFVGRSFYFVCRSSVGKMYELVPCGEEIIKYENDLTAYYNALGSTETDVIKEAEKKLAESYAKATTTNKGNNDGKAGFLFNTNVSLILVALSMLFCSIPYAINLKLHKGEPQKIQIVTVNSVKGENMPDEPNSSQGTSDSGNSTESTQPSTSTPVSADTVAAPSFPANTDTRSDDRSRPEFPNNTYVKEGDQPRHEN